MIGDMVTRMVTRTCPHGDMDGDTVVTYNGDSTFERRYLGKPLQARRRVHRRTAGTHLFVRAVPDSVSTIY